MDNIYIYPSPKAGQSMENFMLCQKKIIRSRRSRDGRKKLSKGGAPYSIIRTSLLINYIEVHHNCSCFLNSYLPIDSNMSLHIN